jgi:hypothetical protein
MIYDSFKNSDSLDILDKFWEYQQSDNESMKVAIDELKTIIGKLNKNSTEEEIEEISKEVKMQCRAIITIAKLSE